MYGFVARTRCTIVCHCWEKWQLQSGTADRLPARLRFLPVHEKCSRSNAPKVAAAPAATAAVVFHVRCACAVLGHGGHQFPSPFSGLFLAQQEHVKAMRCALEKDDRCCFHFR